MTARPTLRKFADLDDVTARGDDLAAADIETTTGAQAKADAAQAAAEAAVIASRPDGFMIDPFEPPVEVAGFTGFNINTGAFNNKTLSNPLPAQNDHVTWAARYLRGGTYTFALQHFTGGSRGIYSIQISTDKQAWTTVGTADGYSSGASVATRSAVAGVQVAAGSYYVRIIMASKNAASQGYVGSISGLSVARTGA